MPEYNFLAIAVAALVPMVMGFLYYGVLFEKPWLDSLGYTKEYAEGGNPAIKYGLALLMAFIVAFYLKTNIELTHKDVVDGNLILGSFHTFKHGALHGAMTSLLGVIPVIVSLGLFQRNTGKNIMLNVLYWIITFAIMGGILDAWI